MYQSLKPLPVRLAATVLLVLAVSAAGTVRAATPVSPLVEAAMARDGTSEIFIVLREQPDFGAVRQAGDRLSRATGVYQTARELALRTQGPLVQWLEARGIEHRRFWIVNQVWVRADAASLAAIVERSEVARIDANPRVLGVPHPRRPPEEMERQAPTGIEWGVQRIGADDVWARFTRGEGIVVGGQDTGIDWDHPALISQYRGWDGVSADHDYNWHDAIRGAGNPCGAPSPVPCDDNGHGTHTIGTAIGDDGGSNQIGVAPGARWIGCRNMDRGYGTPASYTECFEWFIAPYPVGGDPLTEGDPARAPHVINNSWGCPPSEGCTAESLEAVVAATRAAGILVVVSNGNDGSGCSSTRTPPACYEDSFSVGATSSSDALASFSSRGPVDYQGRTYVKPNISAPGVSIRSAVPGGGYQGGWSGISMAGPHVAGAVALLWSAVPELAGNVDLTEDLFESTADPRDFTNCGDAPGAVPNNGYGFGIINALAATEAAVPVTDVQVNGSDGPVNVAAGTPVTVTLASTPGALAGTPAEYYIELELPGGGSLWFVVGSGWVPSAQPLPAFVGTYRQLAGVRILNGFTGMPMGTSQFRFGWDSSIDGSFDGLRVDSAVLQVGGNLTL